MVRTWYWDLDSEDYEDDDDRRIRRIQDRKPCLGTADIDRTGRIRDTVNGKAVSG